jgi:hypothetical protein
METPWLTLVMAVSVWKCEEFLLNNLKKWLFGKKHHFSLARFMFSTASYESRLATHPLICVNYSCGCYIWYDLFVSPHSDKQFLRRKPVDFGQGKTNALEQTGGNRGNSPIRHGQLGYSW